MKADARLAIPVLGAWAAMVALLAPNEGAIPAHLSAQAWILAAIAFVMAVLAVVASTITNKITTKIASTTVRNREPEWVASLLAMIILMALFTLALSLATIAHAPSHVDIKPWEKDPTGGYPWFLDWALALRESLSRAARALPGVGGQLIPGLSIGDTSAVSQSLEIAMKAVSLTHITAVSGANCIIVTASIMILGAKAGLSRTWRVSLAIVALALFVVLVTPEASVVRAAVMSTVVLITLASGRPGTGLPLLAFATLVMLIVNPWWAVDFGFILSVSATAGLLVLARPLALSLSRFMPQLPAMLISIPLAAQLACQPVIVLLQPQIPTYGVLANVIAGPAAPLATVTGLLACLLLPLLPPVGTVLLWVSWLPAQWVGQTALVVAGLPSPSLAWLAGAPGVIVAALCSTAICVVLLHRTKPVRRIVGLGLVLLGGAYIVTGVVSSIVFSASIPQDWTVAACDVGQGDALIVRDGDSVMLIDTGRTPEPVTRCLAQLGISAIDVLILTHFDVDHSGGVAAVYGKVDRALVGTPQDAGQQRVIEDLLAGGASVERGNKGDKGTLGNASWQVLWPAADDSSMQDGNAGSITVRVQTPSLSAIFLGDLGEAAQNALMTDAPLEQVDIVKVAHHGSSDQSAALYRRLAAQLGLISVGTENTYGHPTSTALEMLRQAGTEAVRTDERSLIVVGVTGGSLAVWGER